MPLQPPEPVSERSHGQFGIVSALGTAEIHLLQRFFQRFAREGLTVQATDFVCALRGCLRHVIARRGDTASQAAAAAIIEEHAHSREAKDQPQVNSQAASAQFRQQNNYNTSGGSQYGTPQRGTSKLKS